MFSIFSAKSESRKESFGAAAERELAVLYRVAKRMTLNSEDAEDLVSQTLLLAHGAWDRFDGRHPRSWFIQIMRNEWISIVRKRKVRNESNLEDSEEPTDTGFWQAIDQKLDAEVILGALDSLPEEYRYAVTLCDIEELSYDEAAEALSVPVGTIRSRLFRGRKILRSKLVSLAAQ